MSSSLDGPQNDKIPSATVDCHSTTSASSSPQTNTRHELRPRPLSNPTVWRLFDDEHFPHLLKTILDLSELPHGAFPSDSEDDSEDEDYEASSDDEDPYEYDSQFDSEYDDVASIGSSTDGLDMDIFGTDLRDVAGLESRDKESEVVYRDDGHDKSE